LVKFGKILKGPRQTYQFKAVRIPVFR
jgi:hypothetical protein